MKCEIDGSGAFAKKRGSWAGRGVLFAGLNSVRYREGKAIAAKAGYGRAAPLGA